MAGLLKNDGVFYLSVPIGQDRIEFNAQRVFDPSVIVKLCNRNMLKLIALTVIKEGGQVIHVEPDESLLGELAEENAFCAPSRCAYS